MGPVQILVIGFTEPQFRGEIRAELERLRERGAVRLLDALVVRKDGEGNVERLSFSDLSPGESEELGALVGALVGLGAGDEEGAEAGEQAGAELGSSGHLLGDADAWYVDDVIPDDSAAAIALIEHQWAEPLRDAIERAGGFHLADAWIRADDLVAIGLLGR